MTEKTAMVHVRMPLPLLTAVDQVRRLEGKEISRSRFIVEATREHIAKKAYAIGVTGLVNLFTAEEVPPYWKDDRAINQWLDELRRGSDASLEEKWDK